MKQGKEQKPHIGIFGRCNAGKSSLLNFVTGADTSIVSPREGTTTDAVRKHYEINDFAPVVFIDTAGIDDCSDIGVHRVARTKNIIAESDLAILIFRRWGKPEQELADIFDNLKCPYILLFNSENANTPPFPKSKNLINIDIMHPAKQDHTALMELITRNIPQKAQHSTSMFAHMVQPQDIVWLVCPIDKGAPAGRLILPQVQAIRELLDKNAIAIVMQPQQVASMVERGILPCMVVVDSQIYTSIRKQVPQDIEVTSFSILLAAAKGDYKLFSQGLEHIDKLRDGDTILVAESCNHQISCDDIAREKIPQWLQKYTERQLNFKFISGGESLPEDGDRYSMMIICGGCMVTRKQVLLRVDYAVKHNLPITNYGMLIRKITG